VTAIAKIPKSKSSPPTVVSRDLDRLVGRLTNAIERTPSGVVEICSTSAPTVAERDILGRRLVELNGSLTRPDSHGGRAEIGRMIATLLAGFPTMGADGSTAALNIELFKTALAPFPLWVVREACRRVVDGTAGLNRAYAPTAPQMAELCRGLVQPVLAERAGIEQLLGARVYELPTDEEIARRAEVVEAALAKLTRSNAMAAPDRDRRAAERAHRAKEAGEAGLGVSIAGLQLSDEAVAKVKGEVA
jgi:hypothetical protein